MTVGHHLASRLSAAAAPASSASGSRLTRNVKLIIFDWDSTFAERSGKLNQAKVLYWLRELRRVTDATIGIMSYNTQGVASEDSLILSELKSSGILGEYVHKENIWGYLNACHCREDLRLRENMHPIFCGDITSKARAIGRIARCAGLRPEEILFIDDSAKQVEHARALGACHTYQGFYKSHIGLSDEDWKSIIAFLNGPVVGHRLWMGSSQTSAGVLRKAITRRPLPSAASGFDTAHSVTSFAGPRNDVSVAPIKVMA
ncbi:hypothetical protein FOZ60_013816 [Perkinsus olseni]|uniref:Magnesium-dependent phosphatase 1 n=1 Tax=Perkinsus olseni TaxID=32597 RepID=A0A7J6P7Y7_PEROL|nr:hypothetical protein FOZ60_013816 [Perkinsus olseni]